MPTELQWTKRVYEQKLENMELKVEIEKLKMKVDTEQNYKVFERKENRVLRKIIDTNLVGTKYIVQCCDCETNTPGMEGDPGGFNINDLCSCGCGEYYEYEDFFNRERGYPRPVEATPSYVP